MLSRFGFGLAVALLACFNLAEARLSSVLKADHDGHVQVDVFYDGQCPFASVFITEQLYPTFKALGQYMSVGFHPFANTVVTTNPDGSHVFTCQHGPSECDESIEHACILDHVKENAVQVEMVDCMMVPDRDLKVCLESRVSPEVATAITACANGPKGQELYYLHGQEALAQSVYFSPWIALNHTHNEEIQGWSSQSLRKYLCDKYLQGVPECSTSGV